jgi:hypothetical protein
MAILHQAEVWNREIISGEGQRVENREWRMENGE